MSVKVLGLAVVVLFVTKFLFINRVMDKGVFQLDQIFRNLHSLLIALLVITSCSRSYNNEVKSAIVSVNIKDATRKHKEIRLSSITSSIQYIKLDLKEDSFISTINKVVILDTLLFIMSENHNRKLELLLFDIHGRFIRLIGKSGAGPNEYLGLEDFSVNHNGIYILSTSNEILHYGLNGGFIKRIKLPKDLMLSKMVIFNSQIYILHSMPTFFLNDGYSISCFNENGEITDRFLDRSYHKVTPEIFAQSVGGVPSFFQLINNQLFYWESYNDTIYKLKTDNFFQPVTVFENYNSASVEKFTINEINAGLNNNTVIFSVLPTRDYLFINDFVHKGKRNYLFINYLNNQGYIFGDPGKKIGFINDMDGGCDYIPKGVINDTTIFSYFYPFEIEELNIERSENSRLPGEVSKEITDIVENSTLMDNPILVILVLK